MECKVCGHKHRIWDAEELKVTNEDTEDFIHIQGNFTVHSIDRYWSGVKQVALVACPKCKTVILSD